MTTEGFEAVDWQGQPVHCEACAHRALLDAGRCAARHACVSDRYARRVDRFFKWNPALALDYLAHPYFEVRAIAARYADVFHLPRLLSDPDETVRWNAVQRLPQRYLLQLCSDPDREVRVQVARRIRIDVLPAMARDPDAGHASGRQT